MRNETVRGILLLLLLLLLLLTKKFNVALRDYVKKRHWLTE